MKSINAFIYNLFGPFLHVLGCLLVLTAAAGSALQLEGIPCVESVCTMSIDYHATFVPECAKFGLQFRVEPDSKVKYKQIDELELGNGIEFEIETIDSKGSSSNISNSCSMTAAQFEGALATTTRCFVRGNDGNNTCQISNPESFHLTMPAGCFVEKRVLKGFYRCANNDLRQITKPRVEQTTDSLAFCSACSTKTPSRKACEEIEDDNGTRNYFTNERGECQILPASFNELNSTIRSANITDSDKAKILLNFTKRTFEDAKSVRDFASLLANRLSSNRDFSNATVGNLLKVVGSLANQAFWRQGNNLTASSASEVSAAAAEVIHAVDKIGAGLTASNATVLSAVDGEGGVALSFVRLPPSRLWTRAQPDSKTSLKVAANPDSSPAGNNQAAAVVATSLNLPHLVSRLQLRPGDSPSSIIASRIVQASLFASPSAGKVEEIRSAQILIVLPHLNGEKWIGVKRSCGYLHPHTNQIFQDGCEVVPELSNATATACRCEHLSSFAVIVSPGESWLNVESSLLLRQHAASLAALTYVCLGLSMLCLLLTCVTYAAVRVKSQASDHSIATLHRVHSCLSACLLGAHALFLTGFERGANFGPVACKVVSGFTVYLFLAVFCWLLCEGFMYTKSLIIVLPGVDSAFAKIGFRHYCLLSLLAPLLILAPVAIVRPDEMIQYRVTLDGPGASLLEPRTCWLSDQKATNWAFLGPVFLVCSINLMVFVAILVKLSRRDFAINDGVGNSVTTSFGLSEFMRRQVKLSVTLASLLGLTWLLSLLFLFAQGAFLLTAHYLFVLLTGLQGCFIFVTQIAGHERIREAWERRLLRGGGRCLPDSLRRCLERRRTDRISGTGQKQQRRQQQQQNQQKRNKDLTAGSSETNGSKSTAETSKSDCIPKAEMKRRPVHTEEISFTASSVAAAAPTPHPAPDKLQAQKAEPISVAMETSISLRDIQCACDCGDNKNIAWCEDEFDGEDWHYVDSLPPVCDP